MQIITRVANKYKEEEEERRSDDATATTLFPYSLRLRARRSLFLCPGFNEGGYGTRAVTVLIHFRGFVKSLFCREMCCSTKSAAATGRDMALDILPEAQVRAKRER